MHLAINKLRTGNLNAILVVRGVVGVPARRDSNTLVVCDSVVNTCKYIAAYRALEDTVNGVVRMLTYCRGNRCSPIHNRVADVAERSACVAGLCASSRIISNSYGSMYVCRSMFSEIRVATHRLEVSIHFSINLEFLVGERTGYFACISVNVGDLTHINVNLQVVRPEVIFRPYRFSRIAGNLHIRIKVNNTNRYLCNRCITYLIVLAGTSKCDRSRVGFSVDRIACRETVCQYHLVKYPMVYAVKVNYRFYLLNCFNIRCIKVHPENRTEIKSVFVYKRGVSGCQRYSRSFHTGFNFHETNDRGFVAGIIINLELNAMEAVSNGNIVDRHLSVCQRARYFHAVNVRLGRRCVQAGIVVQRMLRACAVCSVGCFCNVGRHIQQVACCHTTIVFSKVLIAILIVENYRLKDGSLAVFNYLGVVNRDIVNVIRERSVDRTVVCPENIVN